MLRRQKHSFLDGSAGPCARLQNIDSLPLSLYILFNLQVSDAQEAGAPSGGRASEEQVPDELHSTHGKLSAPFLALHFLDFPVQMNLNEVGRAFLCGGELLLECIWKYTLGEKETSH